MVALTDSVAAQIMGELHVLTLKIETQQARTEEVANLVIEAAQLVNKSKTVLHRQNEAFLMDKVKEITAAVAELRAMQGPIQDAASRQVAPLVEQMNRQVQTLAEKDTYAAKFMNQTKGLLEETGKAQESMINKLTAIAVLCSILIVAGFAAGRWLH